jgi:hypothetical protein
MLHPLQPYYDELASYTLAQGGSEFLHQHLVDCFMLHTAITTTKPIGVVFALVGVCLTSEYGFTGRQVQLAHMQLARTKQDYPHLALPDHRGTIPIHDILALPPGNERDAGLRAWCADVWQAWFAHHTYIRGILHQSGVVR